MVGIILRDGTIATLKVDDRGMPSFESTDEFLENQLNNILYLNNLGKMGISDTMPNQLTYLASIAADELDARVVDAEQPITYTDDDREKHF